MYTCPLWGLQLDHTARGFHVDNVVRTMNDIINMKMAFGGEKVAHPGCRYVLCRRRCDVAAVFAGLHYMPSMCCCSLLVAASTKMATAILRVDVGDD